MTERCFKSVGNKSEGVIKKNGGARDKRPVEK